MVINHNDDGYYVEDEEDDDYSHDNYLIRII